MNTTAKSRKKLFKPRPNLIIHIWDLAKNSRKFSLKNTFPFVEDEIEIIEKVKMIDQLGFNLRAAAQFVRTASKFKCSIQVKSLHGYVNGKSLLNLMGQMGICGPELTLKLRGPDAREAWSSMRELFLNKFGDP